VKPKADARRAAFAQSDFERSVRLGASMLALTRDRDLWSENLDTALRTICRTAAHALGIERVSVWALRSLADLRGRSIGFEDDRSTSGYVIPRVLLENAGVELQPAASAPRPGAARSCLRFSAWQRSCQPLQRSASQAVYCATHRSGQRTMRERLRGAPCAKR
jgi:hypothetical protein